MKRTPVKLDGGAVESLLEKVVTDLIAHDLGIKPEEVTLEFIHNWREEHLYPKAEVNSATRYGGYVGVGRRVLTGAEIEAHKRQAEEFMSKF